MKFPIFIYLATSVLKNAAIFNNIEMFHYLLQLLNIRIIDGCFKDCQNLYKISIPSIVDSIGNFTFMNCSNLQEIILPSSIASIGERSFFNCESLLNITIPSSCKYIGVEAFYNCQKITQIILNI